MRVELSYEEQIMNALSHLPRVTPREHLIARGQREHTAIRAVLKPLYDRAKAAEARAEQAEAHVQGLAEAVKAVITKVDADIEGCVCGADEPQDCDPDCYIRALRAALAAAPGDVPALRETLYGVPVTYEGTPVGTNPAPREGAAGE